MKVHHIYLVVVKTRVRIRSPFFHFVVTYVIGQISMDVSSSMYVFLYWNDECHLFSFEISVDLTPNFFYQNGLPFLSSPLTFTFSFLSSHVLPCQSVDPSRHTLEVQWPPILPSLFRPTPLSSETTVRSLKAEIAHHLFWPLSVIVFVYTYNSDHPRIFYVFSVLPPEWCSG